MKKISMFFLDWLVVPIWCALFPLGEVISAVIMMFVTAVFSYLNYRDCKKTVTLFLQDINLMGAAVLGILLNNLLFIRFIYADREKVSAMVLIIFLALVYLTFIMIISMTVKEIGRKRRRRIIDRLASSDDPDQYVKDEDPDDDDYYDDNDDEDSGFETERRVLASMNRMSDNGRDDNVIPDDDDDEEDENADPDESKGPKFKVIKKNRGSRG